MDSHENLEETGRYNRRMSLRVCFLIPIVIVGIWVVWTISGIVISVSHFKPYGKLIIPDVGIDVALYKASDDSQEIVDTEYAAAYIHWNHLDFIADHRSQAFYALPSVTPNETHASIVRGGEIEEYLCIFNGPGYIKYQDVGTSIVELENGDPITKFGDGLICMYTCNGKLQDDNTIEVIITLWQPMVEREIVNFFLTKNLIAHKSSGNSGAFPFRFL